MATGGTRAYHALMRTIIFCCCLLPVITSATDLPAPVTATVRVVAAAPDRVELQWRFDLADGWHLYGPHRNDTGQPPTVDLDLPDGWTASSLDGWRAPVRHVVADLILDHIYEDSLVLRQTLRRPPDATAATVTAKLRWLVCREMCVPGDTVLTVDLGTEPAPGWAVASPRPLPPDLVRSRHRGDRVVIESPGARSLTLVPDADGPALVDLLHDGRADGDRLVIRLAGSDPAPLTGLLIIDHNDSQVVGRIDVRKDEQGGTP